MFFLPELYSETRMHEIDITPGVINEITYEESENPFGDDFGGRDENSNK
jgi:hypothetical protein